MSAKWMIRRVGLLAGISKRRHKKVSIHECSICRGKHPETRCAHGERIIWASKPGNNRPGTWGWDELVEFERNIDANDQAWRRRDDRIRRQQQRD